MTIKNTNKNVSAENHEDVVVSASFENGVLTLIRKNLYDESISEGKKILIDMHKLKLKVLDSKQTLDQLETSTREEDIRERESYIFLVPFETGEEGVYREYIWVEEENDVNGGEFEVIGSTKTDLEPYFKKENVYNALDYIEAGKALDARQGKVLNDKFNDYVIKETGKGLSTNDFTAEEKNKLATYKKPGTFTELKALIDNAPSGGTIILDRDYINMDNISKIFIQKDLTIIGNNHIIDSKGYSLFMVFADDVVFNKIYFINTSEEASSFITFDDIASHEIINCVFINPILNNTGGINYQRTSTSKLVIKESLFVNIKFSIPSVMVDSYNSKYINCTKDFSNFDYLITHQDITGKEDVSNKITSLSSSSTDIQYPSAKATYDAIPKETITLTINYTDGSPSEDIEFYIKQ